MAMHLGSRDLSNFWEISANISEIVQDRDIVTLYNGTAIENHKCPLEWHQYR